MGMPRFAWGIDVGNRALKAIRIVRDGENEFRIDDFDVIEHEHILSQAGDNRETLIQSALANFAQKHGSRGGAVAIGVSGQASFARFIKLPPVDPSKIVEIVKFEAIQQIPFPLEDVEWSYQLFQSPDSPEVEVGIFAMRRELVNQVIKNFTDVGIEVSAVQMNPLAVYNGLAYDERIDGTTMIVDVGAENSDLLIAEGESIWMRSIPIGGNNFTEALVKAFKLKFPKAEELKRNAATSKYGRQILQAMKPIFSDLVGEIQRSIGFYSSTHRDSRISRVLAMGGTFRLPGLQKYLQQNLQLDVHRIDRLKTPMPSDARFATTFNENVLSSVGAYGLALQAMGLAKVTSSLLPEKIRRERMWRQKTKWFALAASLFVIGTAVPIGRLYADRYAYDGQADTREKIAREANRVKGLDGAWKQIESSGGEDRAKISGLMSLLTGRTFAVDIADQIAKAFPAPDPKDASLPRPQRKSVELVGWTMHYQPDIVPLIFKRDEEFNAMLDHADMVSGALSNPTGGAGSFQHAYIPGVAGMPPMPPGMGPLTRSPAPTATTGTESKAPARGFLITITCRTPAAEPTALISETVVKALRDSRGGAGQNLSFERVTIPLRVKFSERFPTGLAKPKKQPLIFVPPAGNDAGLGADRFNPPPLPPTTPNPAFINPGVGGRGLAQPPGGYPQGPAGYPPFAGVQPRVGGQLNAQEKEQAFADPQHEGESLADDSLVTVLAAVVIDPPPEGIKPSTGTAKPGAPTGPAQPPRSRADANRQ